MNADEFTLLCKPDAAEIVTALEWLIEHGGSPCLRREKDGGLVILFAGISFAIADALHPTAERWDEILWWLGSPEGDTGVNQIIDAFFPTDESKDGYIDLIWKEAAELRLGQIDLMCDATRRTLVLECATRCLHELDLKKGT